MLTFMVGTTFAQTSNINKAVRFMDAGDLAAAKEAIDMAAVHEKTMGKARTWYELGRVYNQIAISESADVQALAPDAIEKAMEAYSKVYDMESEGSNYYTLTELQVENFWGAMINKGAVLFQNQDYPNAITEFDKVKLIKPEDTTAYLYAGIAAQTIDNYDALLDNFGSLVDLGYKNIDVYNSLIYYTKTHSGDTLGALDLVRKARQDFPSNDELRKQEVNLLIQTGQIEDAKNGLEEAIAAEPDNANLYFNLGYLYEELGEPDKAIENYAKAVEVDPTYFDAVYNLGVFYYNRAAELYSEAAEMSLSDYNKRGAEVEEQAKENLRLAMPHMKSSSELRPEEAVIWQTLSTIYTRLGMNSEAESAFMKYEELSGN